MVHKDRVFSIAEVATAEELAQKLHRVTYCLCNGFKLGAVLYLNDSFSEDGAQEYGVVTGAIQFESITVKWCNEETLLEMIRELQDDAAKKNYAFESPFTNKVESHVGHRCAHCA